MREPSLTATTIECHSMVVIRSKRGMTSVGLDLELIRPIWDG